MSAVNPPAQSLLLLPPLPSPATYPAIKAAYKPPLTAILTHLKSSIPGRSILDIALPCPHLAAAVSPAPPPRSSLYAATQSALAKVYKLICVVAAQHDVEIADVPGDSVDVRVLLVGWGVKQNTASDNVGELVLGPVVTLEVLAKSERQWKIVYGVEGEHGKSVTELFKRYTLKNRYHYEILHGKESPSIEESSSLTTPDVPQHVCSSSVIGGTFDHLHVGHKLLLTMLMFTVDPPSSTAGPQSPITKIVTIGMTAADLLAKKKHAHLLQSWSTRTDRTHFFVQSIISFSKSPQETSTEIHNEGPNGHMVTKQLPWGLGKLELRYVEIWDAYGPTITDGEIDTIVVSGETRQGGPMVNDRRVADGMSRLVIWEVDVLDASDEKEEVKEGFDGKLSSSMIRKAIAERENKREVEKSKV